MSNRNIKVDLPVLGIFRKLHIPKWKLYGLLILLFINSPYALARELDMKHEKINICDYNAQNIKDLEKKLNQAVLFSNETRLASFFQNTPSEPQHSKKINPKLNKLTGIPLGKIHSIFFRCSISDRNTNEWLLMVLENEEKIITKLNLYLFYVGENFSSRNEPITSDRFASSTELAKAINDKNESHKYSRKVFRDEMLNGGFLLHRSCNNEQGKTDIYFLPPLSPESIEALIGAYFIPDVRPGISVSFSNDGGHLLYAQPPIGQGSGKCKSSWELYNEQTTEYLIEHYPDSWFAKFFIQNNLRK